MITVLSVITAVKDYVEVVHKLIETDSLNFISAKNQTINSYNDFGAMLTYFVLLVKQFLGDFLSLKWFQAIYSFPVVIPNIASAMISEISVLDGYFHNVFTFLEIPISYGNQNFLFSCIEKFSIGILNSLFLFLPTSTAHLICLRRFVMQGLEAGYIAGLGTIAGNMVWIGSFIFGFRFLVIPWLSLDIVRYGLGFLLLIKYMWDSYSEKRTVLENLSKKKIFLLNFLLTFTEQTNIYPFVSNLSISSDSTFLEGFPTESFPEFVGLHGSYLAGIFLGSFSLLQFTCWFWENPAFNLYMWAISSFKGTTGVYSKTLNFVFLYLTMISAISSISYFGLDYTITNPLGFVHEDRLFDQKGLLETAFLNTKPSDRNTRRNRGRHGRRERWKRRVRRYRTFDASLYDQGIYDLFTVEDLNYGFDRFWLRRKMRNHRVHFRFFPGPWMRSFKKQLSRPRLESYMGPRMEFFRILFEQVYHPQFHEFQKKSSPNASNSLFSTNLTGNSVISNLTTRNKIPIQENSLLNSSNSTKTYPKKTHESSTLRKFIRKVNNRLNSAKIHSQLNSKSLETQNFSNSISPIYSKNWKFNFSKNSNEIKNSKFHFQKNSLKRLSKNVLSTNKFKVQNSGSISLKNRESLEKLSKKNRQILRYKTLLSQQSSFKLEENKKNNEFSHLANFATSKPGSKTLETLTFSSPLNSNTEFRDFSNISLDQTGKFSNLNKKKNENFTFFKPLTLFHPVKFYLKKEQAFQRKLKFYGANVYRTISLENNAPYFRTMMQKFFYYYKPTLRWERTMRTATMRKARRKNSRLVRKLNINKETKGLAELTLDSSWSTKQEQNESPIQKRKIVSDSSNSKFDSKTISYSNLQKPTHFYSLVSKRATRYRSQIYKDVLQHWYYTPFNRLLLKFDVDGFIRRQPNSHFLTKSEEQLLHLRRFLLGEHYETLRWYTYMQHYNSMKSKIGGTKSFSNRSYSQQFMGTLKKVRHLFALTPSSSNINANNNVLKFDQLLYNEYSNQQSKPLLENSLIHEELLADTDFLISSIPFSSISKQEIPKMQEQVEGFLFKNNTSDDLLTQSTKILKEYLIRAIPIRNQVIEKLIAENNYWELSNFLFKGQKTRGVAPVTNEHAFFEQETQYLSNPGDTGDLNTFVLKNHILTTTENKEFQQELWFELLKKCQNTLFDQESLKNYLIKHVEKRKKQNQKQKNDLTNRLKRFETWFLKEKNQNSLDVNSVNDISSGLQKGVKESIFYQNGFSILSVKSNLRNNMKKIQFSENTNFIDNRNVLENSSKSLKAHLINRVKQKQISLVQIEENLKKSLFLEKTKLKVKQSKDSRSIRILFSKAYKNFSFAVKKVLHTLKINSLNSVKNFIPFLYKKTERNMLNIEQSKQKEWRKQEVSLTKRKKTRKTLKRLKNKNQRNVAETSKNQFLNNGKNENSNVREKEDFLLEKNSKILKGTQERQVKSWNQWLKTTDKNSFKLKTDQDFSSSFQNFFLKKFKRKRSRSRRNRRLRSRRPIKKSTLGEKLKRQFRLLKRYSRSSEQALKTDKKIEIFKLITKRKYEPTSQFITREIKQKRIRQAKQRVWKEKKQKFSQNKRKQRKRRRNALGKLRSVFKEYKRKQALFQIQNWWWQSFFPNFRATVEQNWQTETNTLLKNQFSQYSDHQLLKSSSALSSLQIGDKDFKPLAVPQAIQIREELSNQNLLKFHTNSENSTFSKIEQLQLKVENKEKNQTNSKEVLNSEIKSKPKVNLNILNELTKNTLLPNFTEIQNQEFSKTDSPIQIIKEVKDPFLKNLNPVPFYAGWDESLRKFVVTNRFLSLQNQHSNFSNSALKGMNAATTLYWQIPFTTYDPDQFFALGMDGFSPIGWRKFHFRHSTETTKPILVQSKTQNFAFSKFENSQIENSNLLSYNLQQKIVKSSNLNLNLNSYSKQRNQLRRTQKRYKRVKKHPRPPVWFPSGPLVNQVLPVHYIYVFYKRNRLPRDRYIRRRLRRNFEILTKNFLTNFVDFTLRKRSKPRRKYHRKRHISKNETLILKRRSFRQIQTQILNTNNTKCEQNQFSRPTPLNFSIAASIDKMQKRKSSYLNKQKNTKQSAENLRIRQLRRRVQRQVFRPVWRYKPRAGGYTWPGDYLRLELIKAPILNSSLKNSSFVFSSENKNETKSKKSRKKKRKPIQEWQIQPKKYLLQKHNLKVLKKRLEKSQNSFKLFKNAQNFNSPID